MPVLLLAALSILAVQAQDRAVIANLRAQFGIKAKVIKHVDLTEPFQTKVPWRLVVAKQADEESKVVDGSGDPIGAVYVCFVENGRPDCSHAESPFYELFAADIVFAGPEKTLPLVSVRACGSRGANGNCTVSTLLFDYDVEARKFRVVFANRMGRNNNEEARFVESGPLHGSVIVAYPTSNAPFTYFVEVHQRTAGNDYSLSMKYRGTTGYADGNRLAVIDSQMPETLRRLGLWNVGGPLPVPPRLPRGCTLALRKGLAWCK